MRLVVISHKACWRSASSPSGFATDGGFSFQMRALASLFAHTTVCVPITATGAHDGEVALYGDRLEVVPLPAPGGAGVWRKVRFPVWVLRSLPALVREIRAADAVHAPIPGDVGTMGIVVAHLFRRPLFVRHCGNWTQPRTKAERLWRWYMERAAGGRRVMLATGGSDQPPSRRNPAVRWIFSTSMTADELDRIAKLRTIAPGHAPRLVIVGRQVEAKGTGRVIEALRVLQGDLPEATLEVVGDGPDLARFKALADDLGVGDRVSFTGQVDHDGVLAALDRADLFVFPTTSSEGFPKAALEALASGLPVLATPVSVLPDLLAGGGGIVLRDASPASIASGVRNATSSPAQYQLLSAHASAAAAAFSLERWVGEIGKHLAAAWPLDAPPLATTSELAS
jgi:glycosyltransferase involved in cell wall biosynthesis